MKREEWASFGLGMLGGAVIGGVVALLYAPKSGKETRALIGEEVGKVKDVVGEKVDTVRQTVGEKADTIKQNVGEKVTKARHNLGQAIADEECAPASKN